MRLNCRHIMHANCMSEYTAHVLAKNQMFDRPTADCPQCCGSGEILATYSYVGENTFRVAEDNTSERSARSEGSRSPTVPRPAGLPSESPASSSRHAPQYPWWPVSFPIETDEAEMFAYHAATRLTDGRHGLLIDPGAWNNLAGENWIKEVAKKALDHGHEPRQNRMKQPFTVKGVGKGTNAAEWEVQLPIAISE